MPEAVETDLNFQAALTTNATAVRNPTVVSVKLNAA